MVTREESFGGMQGGRGGRYPGILGMKWREKDGERVEIVGGGSFHPCIFNGKSC